MHVGVVFLGTDYLKVKKFTDQLLFNTTRIEVYKDDKLESCGTGFVYAHVVEGKGQVEFLVTNKHLFPKNKRNSSYTTRVYFHMGEPERNLAFFSIGSESVGKTIKIPLAGVPFYDHPSENVDITAIEVGQYLHLWDEKGSVPAFYKTFPSIMVPDESKYSELFEAVESVLVVGYPYAFIDLLHNVPIIRKGITATPVYLNFTYPKMSEYDQEIFL